jgi:hypothetical protein
MGIVYISDMWGLTSSLIIFTALFYYNEGLAFLYTFFYMFSYKMTEQMYKPRYNIIMANLYSAFMFILFRYFSTFVIYIGLYSTRYPIT